jgi:nicotinate-nucleotide adenylyltransferase
MVARGAAESAEGCGRHGAARDAPCCGEATANHPRILVVDAEHTLSTRYTIDTLKALKRRFRHVDFVWLMGSDNLEGFHHWRRWQEIAQLVPSPWCSGRVICSPA